MKKKQKLFLGFAVIVIMAIFTLSSCASLAEMFKTPEFPEEFRGTWVRDYPSPYSNTLTFTSTTIKDSSQGGDYWKLTRVSGDAYTFAIYNDPNWKFTNIFKIVGGNLEITGNSSGTAEDDWDGIWKKR